MAQNYKFPEALRELSQFTVLFTYILLSIFNNKSASGSSVPQRLRINQGEVCA